MLSAAVVVVISVIVNIDITETSGLSHISFFFHLDALFVFTVDQWRIWDLSKDGRGAVSVEGWGVVEGLDTSPEKNHFLSAN